MRTMRVAVRGTIALVLCAIASLPAAAQQPPPCSTHADILVDGNPVERLPAAGEAACLGFVSGLRTVGGIRIQRYDWSVELGPFGGWAFHIHAQFMNDIQPYAQHTISVTQTLNNLPNGLRRWNSSYDGEAHETPGPAGNASDGTTFVTPNHFDASINGTGIGSFDFPINVTPSPLAVPFSGQSAFQLLAANNGIANLQATLGRGDVLNIQDTASIYAAPTSVPASGTWGLLVLVLAILATSFYVLTRARRRERTASA